MTITIRQAETGDAASLAKLNWQFNDIRMLPEQIAHSLDTNTDEKVFVACLDGQVVGFVVLHVHRSFCYPATNGEITELFVAEGARNRGVGLALMQATLALAKALQLDEVFLRTSPDYRVANRLYHKLGMRLGRTNTYYAP